jgi:hypothetical protein
VVIWILSSLREYEIPELFSLTYFASLFCFDELPLTAEFLVAEEDFFLLADPSREFPYESSF